MKVVLLQDIAGTGKKDDIINVSDGYARNYLIPRKLAAEASAQALNDIKNKERAKEHRIAEEKKAAQALAFVDLPHPFQLVGDQRVDRPHAEQLDRCAVVAEDVIAALDGLEPREDGAHHRLQLAPDVARTV